MMTALVIGGDGFVGSALVALLRERRCDVAATTRRPRAPGIFLAMALPVQAIPAAEAVFIVAAVNTFQACEGNPQAYRVNVDAPVEIARLAIAQGGFPVFVSSDAVEWCGASAYARQKALAELGVRMVGGAVVRPSRVEPHRVGNLCELLLDVATRRLPGVHHWKSGRVTC
jgi:dTDP-4-dehydrorhamnose reductase